MWLLNRKVLTVFLALAIFWFGQAAWHGYIQRSVVQVQVNDLEAKLNRVEQDNQFLASASAYFKSDEYLGKQARLKLNYKLSDENVAFIYPDKSEKTASASLPAGRQALMVEFSAIKNWLKNLFK